MKLLIPLLLLTFNSFSQTGKITSNGTITIRYETIAGITNVVIQNNSQLESVIEYKYNGFFHLITLPYGRSVNFKIMDGYFFISARNITDLSGGSQWIDVDSRIRALEIKAEKKSRLQNKIQCDETNFSSIPADNIRVRKKPV